MTIASYSDLKTAVATWASRADLTSVIPDFITMAEAQMHRRFLARLRTGQPYPRRLIVRSDASIAEDDEYIAVPDDYGSPVNFTLSSDPITRLDYLDSTNLQGLKAANQWTGAPKWYSVIGGSIQLYPVADAAYTAELTYISRFPALSDVNTTNWILEDYPDAYLYGALLQSEPYLRNDARIAVWGGLFTTIIEDICNADPMPSDKTVLRTDIPLSRNGHSGFYNIQTDD